MEQKQGADAKIDFFSPSFFFLFSSSVFLMPAEKKKGIGKACRVINMSDDVVSVIREPVSWRC